jgi:hypothetical protein
MALSGMPALFGPAFEATPHPYLLLTPDDFKIAGVNNAYLAVTMTRRDELLGCGIFKAFPDNPDDPQADGVASLTASLIHLGPPPLSRRQSPAFPSFSARKIPETGRVGSGGVADRARQRAHLRLRNALRAKWLRATR